MIAEAHSVRAGVVERRYLLHEQVGAKGEMVDRVAVARGCQVETIGKQIDQLIEYGLRCALSGNRLVKVPEQDSRLVPVGGKYSGKTGQKATVFLPWLPVTPSACDIDYSPDDLPYGLQWQGV